MEEDIEFVKKINAEGRLTEKQREIVDGFVDKSIKHFNENNFQRILIFAAINKLNIFSSLSIDVTPEIFNKYSSAICKAYQKIYEEKSIIDKEGLDV